MERKPSRGEIWLVDLDPSMGHEQRGKRPCLVLSDDLFNHGPGELVVVLPLTSRKRDIPLRIPVVPPEGGLKSTSYVMPEMIRSISLRRLSRRLGRLRPDSLVVVEAHVRALLQLD